MSDTITIIVICIYMYLLYFCTCSDNKNAFDVQKFPCNCGGQRIESEVTILINRFVFVGTLSNDVFNKQDSIHHIHLVLKCHS